MESLTSNVHNLSNLVLNTVHLEWKKEIETAYTSIKKDFKDAYDGVCRTLKKSDQTELDLSRKLNQRKFNFYESVRNEGIAQIYQKSLQESVPKVPRKFFKNPVPHLNSIENDLRKELIIKEVEHEIKRLKMTAELKSNFVKRIDNEVTEFFNNRYDHIEAQAQILKWIDTTKKEETVIKNIWEEKSKFFDSDKHLLPMDSRSKRQMRNFVSYADITRNNYFQPNFNRFDNFLPRRNNIQLRNNTNFRNRYNGNFQNRPNNRNFPDNRMRNRNTDMSFARNNFSRRMNNRNNTFSQLKNMTRMTIMNLILILF